MLLFDSKVRQWFKEAVNLHPTAASELKHSVLQENPVPLNVQLFLDNLTRELKKADKINMRRGVYLKEKTYQETVYDMTNLFISGFESVVNKRKESELARVAREAEDAKKKEFDDVLAGNATGEFAEAGVISDEKEDNKRERALEIEDRKKAALAVVR